MIKLLKFTWLYYKLYRYQTKEKHLRLKVEENTKKFDALKELIITKYVDETEFVKRVALINNVTKDKSDKYRDLMIAQKEKNKRLVLGIPLAEKNISFMEADDEKEDVESINDILTELGQDDGKNRY
jgi:hypothetical protein